MTDNLRYKSFQEYLEEPVDFDFAGNPIPRRYSLGLFGVEIMELVWNAAREPSKNAAEEKPNFEAIGEIVRSFSNGSGLDVKLLGRLTSDTPGIVGTKLYASKAPTTMQTPRLPWSLRPCHNVVNSGTAMPTKDSPPLLPPHCHAAMSPQGIVLSTSPWCDSWHNKGLFTIEQLHARDVLWQAKLDAAREAQAPQGDPAISTKHGPWLQSEYDENETYCQRCKTRSIFANNRQCDPHIVYTAPAPAVPKGWRLVPIEPDQKMLSEGSCAYLLPGPRYMGETAAKLCWDYMIDSAPTPPAQAEPNDWLDLVSAAVGEDAGYIEHYHGSWNSERTRCTACGATDFDGFVGGASLDHKPDCKWVAKQEAIKTLRSMAESLQTNKINKENT